MPSLKNRNAKWELFCQGIAKGKSQDQAYLDAGFKGKPGSHSLRGKASELRSRPIIASRIDELLAKSAERAEITVAEILKGIHNIATADIGEAFDEMGNLKPIHEIPKNVRLALSSVQVDEIKEHNGSNWEVIGYSKKLRLENKSLNWQNLGRYKKMFTDKMEHNVSEDLAGALEKARKRSKK